MAHLHPLLAEKDPSLVSVTIHSHPFPSFASKIINTKQLGLMLLNLVDIVYKKRYRKGKQLPYVASVFLNTLGKKSLGESAAAAATRTRSSFAGVSQCVENSGEPRRNFEISAPRQLYPASRTALTRVSCREAPGNQLHVELLRERNNYLLKSGEHQKARLARRRYFPGVLLQLPMQRHEGGTSSVSSTVALLAPCQHSSQGNTQH